MQEGKDLLIKQPGRWSAGFDALGPALAQTCNAFGYGTGPTLDTIQSESNCTQGGGEQERCCLAFDGASMNSF